VSYFKSYGVKIELTDEILGKGFEKELVEDILSLMASFSAKIYGKRSSQNRKKKEESNV
jgi:predicted site-specific integrase-resolvase